MSESPLSPLPPSAVPSEHPAVAPPPATTALPGIVAEVRARQAVMRYRRAGAGRAVLVLHPGEPACPLWLGLLEALAARHRVFLPDLPDPGGPGADVAGWIGGFLEGLGVVDALVVAADPFGAPALERALGGAEEIARLVLVPAGPGDAAWLDGLADRASAAGLPLLVVPPALAAPEVVPLVLGFLAGHESGSTAAPAPAAPLAAPGDPARAH